ncbi:hypothetical protein [Corynebacterium aquilae]|uniref:Uncharacterized protein n=1 Tax=Corynebacterium aquilae DSM 44791 TaxID=1431546 RepID=A0A1L7CHW8_9CORY|nr:hypothetical protein [Corynebacterium aquilae]APT85419.1 hypothetical protein CAQU_10575 [Corynebacterium aquilae DSM 44791]
MALTTTKRQAAAILCALACTTTCLPMLANTATAQQAQGIRPHHPDPVIPEKMSPSERKKLAEYRAFLNRSLPTITCTDLRKVPGVKPTDSRGVFAEKSRRHFDRKYGIPGGAYASTEYAAGQLAAWGSFNTALAAKAAECGVIKRASTPPPALGQTPTGGSGSSLSS